jgi:hypothetical protein
MSLIRVTLAVLVLFPVMACETAPKTPSPARLAGASAEKILLLPLNVVRTLRPELEESSEIVWEALAAYIQEHGKQLQTISLSEARNLWLGSIQQIEASGATKKGFYEVSEIMARRLHEQVKFDALIIPSLFVQNAKMRGKTAVWDRVKRRVQIASDLHSVGSILTKTTLVGDTPGASLHALALNSTGEKIFEERAGLELLKQMRVHRGKGGRMEDVSYTWELRPDLFSNEEDVREGIVKTLSPFLPPLAAKKK